MSNWLAIATTTATLRAIAETAAKKAVAGARVHFGRPQSPPDAQPHGRLYLYMVTPNAALRNSDLPTRNAGGQLMRRAHVALDLYYLLSFYGDEVNLEPQRMMGAVVRDLHVQPVLTRPAIQAALDDVQGLTDSDLAEAVEQVKFSPLSLSTEEMSKLWSVFFQTPHALSMAYQGSVVLITSEETGQLARPVLRRGEDDRGAEAQPDSLPRFPALDSIHIEFTDDKDSRVGRRSLSAAQLGHALTLRGRNLTGDTVLVRFVHHRVRVTNEQNESVPLQVEISVPDTDRTDNEIYVVLPQDDEANSKWAAGLYSVSVICADEEGTRTTNILPLPLAPRIREILPAGDKPRQGDDKSVALQIQFSPRVVVNQQAVMALLMDGEVGPEPIPDPLLEFTTAFEFKFIHVRAIKKALVTLRVDGVDSLPLKIDQSQGGPSKLVFDPVLEVTIV